MHIGRMHVYDDEIAERIRKIEQREEELANSVEATHKMGRSKKSIKKRKRVPGRV